MTSGCIASVQQKAWYLSHHRDPIMRSVQPISIAGILGVMGVVQIRFCIWCGGDLFPVRCISFPGTVSVGSRVNPSLSFLSFCREYLLFTLLNMPSSCNSLLEQVTFILASLESQGDGHVVPIRRLSPLSSPMHTPSSCISVFSLFFFFAFFLILPPQY